jgi:hypothetical protein
MSITGKTYTHGWTDTRLPQIPKEELRLRDNGDGVWAIVRVKAGARFGTEVIAGGLTLKAASQMLELAKEK